MLRLRPIRTKLWAAGTLMSLVLILLGASALWGLYGYRSVAAEISHQAVEIPVAVQMHQMAMTMRESHGRSKRLRTTGGLGGGGMINAATLQPLDEMQLLERQTFDAAAVILDSSVERYRQAFQSRPRRSVWLDDHAQAELIGEIETTLAALHRDRTMVSPFAEDNDEAVLDHLDRLVDQTDRLVAMIHDGMANFGGDVRARYRTFIGVAWVSLLSAASLIILFGFAFRSYVVKPFQTLLTGARSIAAGEKYHVIELGTGDELSELAQAMNGMTMRFRRYYLDLDAEVQRRSEECLRNEQLASVGFLAAGVAHEINNPLAGIAWNAESLQTRINDSGDAPDLELRQETTHALGIIETEAYRAKAIIDRLLDFSRPGNPERASHDLRPMTEDLATMVSKIEEFRSKSISIEGDTELFAHIDPHEIRQVLLNLIFNAMQAVDPDGRVQVVLDRRGDRAVVQVIDDGCGMTPEVRRHLFEPFYTRRRDGSGTGLGLSITSRIVSRHGGSLQAVSAGEGCGSTFHLELPTQPGYTEDSPFAELPDETQQAIAALPTAA